MNEQQRAQLLLILNRTATEIEAKLDAERPPQSPWNHFQNNWASEYHHPCKKFLTHCRLDWKKRKSMDITGRWRVEEGKDKEWQVKKWLGDIGFRITKDQFYFSTDDPGLEKYKHLHISGKIDGMVEIPKHILEEFPADLVELFLKHREVPIEIKSVGPQYWDSTRTIEDITRHPKFWISKIPSQLNTYFVFGNWFGGLLVVCTFGKRPRILPMLFNGELWEHDQRTADEVSKHVAAGTLPPPIPYDSEICGMCDFYEICQPLSARNNLIGIKDGDTPRLELYCEMEEELKEREKKFKALKAELIGNEEKPGIYFGKEAHIDIYEISTSIQNRKRIIEEKKDEIKKFVAPFQEEYKLKTTKIRRIDK